GGVRLADPAGFLRAQWQAKARLRAHPVTGEGLATYGTEVLMNVINEAGALPTRNFTASQFEEADAIGGETLKETRLLTNKACFACTIACGRVNKLGDGSGKFAVTTHPRNWKIATEGPEYEPAWALGADTGVGDLDAVLKANYLCNELGMDPISLGSTIASAMELYETGAIDDSHTAIPLRFGSAEALVRMTEAAAYREGFGAEIAEGARRMTEKFGRPELFMGVKSSEFPAYDPRAIQGMGLGYATSNRGACHLRSYTVSPEILGIPEKLDPAVTENKAYWTRLFQDVSGVFDAAGLCVFLTFGIGLEDAWPELACATGVPYTLDDLMRAGERIWNLERLWNQRAGFTGKDDTLPKRILQEPISAGPMKGSVNRLGEMLPEYYRLRGWTEDGRPTPERLQELGLPAG
ncbi:MAG: aldehyde ferredoxin oxidoreductase, partial [Armatimonadetes bacterium]|nr:aldehyde ferredoxin oxidoreductase [Armatimonadota bacterium]